MSTPIVIANSIGERAIRKGAKCYILSMEGMGDQVFMSVHSRGGRIIKKWTSIKKLVNARVANLPDAFWDRIGGCGYHGRSIQVTVDTINLGAYDAYINDLAERGGGTQ